MNLTDTKKKSFVLACIFHLIILLSYTTTTYSIQKLNENVTVNIKCDQPKKILKSNISSYINKEIVWKNGKAINYDKKYCDKIASSIVDHADHPYITTGIIFTESKYDKNAKNKSSKTLGLGQIHPIHKDELIEAGIIEKKFTELTDIDKNVKAINFVLNKKLEITNGNIKQALIYYSGGSKGYNKKVLKKVENLKLYCENKNTKLYKYN